jgi:plastocyanin
MERMKYKDRWCSPVMMFCFIIISIITSISTTKASTPTPQPPQQSSRHTSLLDFFFSSLFHTINTPATFTMFTKTAISALLLLAAGSSAAPTATPRDQPSATVPLTGVTHSVSAGLGGLRFDPDNVVAQVGDIVQFEFLPRNHSVAQSDFANPCQPLADGTGFFSGFNFPVQEGKSADVFQIVVEDDSKPIWYYCPQTVGSHCQNGMVGVINQNFNNPDFSLAKHRELAAQTDVSIVPAVQQGGVVEPNPNP